MRISTEQAAERLGLSVNFLREKLKNGELRDICDVYVGKTGRCTYVIYSERIDEHIRRAPT